MGVTKLFVIMYDQVPKNTLDWWICPGLQCISIAVENMADIIKLINLDVQKQLEDFNAKYKANADAQKRLKVF